MSTHTDRNLAVLQAHEEAAREAFKREQKRAGGYLLKLAHDRELRRAYAAYTFAMQATENFILDTWRVAIRTEPVAMDPMG